MLKRAGFTLAEISRLLERKGSAAALVEARIVALRSEVRSKAQALAALNTHGADWIRHPVTSGHFWRTSG